MDSVGSYDPCTDYLEGCAEYGERGEYHDVGLQSEMGSNRSDDHEFLESVERIADQDIRINYTRYRDAGVSSLP
ncbi:hypothetical protein P4O66_002699 [Electrophorus voltai]|uniref:Uncharacterized protein n=1 Tax=Electrophorus voltai TaxID=2609070 RepID=A0AAD9DL49_9TELE|nr:hypothetical protein P4O66_002699 [Electrophorus voltai]